MFGDGSDGPLTISSNTTDTPIDSSCSGITGTVTLAATNASFTSTQKILIHQSRGTNAGVWETNEIASYSPGTIALSEKLKNTYTDGGDSQAQVIVLREYTDVTVNSGVTWSAKIWDGNVGGILAFLAIGEVQVNGTINVNGINGNEGSPGNGGLGLGFRGGNSRNGLGANDYGYAGEGINRDRSLQRSPNGNGGGGGYTGSIPNGQAAAGGGGYKAFPCM